MEEEATSTVIHGTLIMSGLSAFATGLYGISRRNPNYGFLAAAAAINSGVTAFTFFGIREFIISPLLVHSLPWPQYARRRHGLGIDKPEESASPIPSLPTWSDLRQHKTLDSGISGALAGGLLRGWKSGRRAIIPGSLSIGAVCTLLQLAFNELSITRLKYLSKSSGTVALPKSFNDPSSKSISEHILAFLGMKEVTDEEYLEKMKKKREGYLKQIAELEKQLAREHDDRSSLP